MFERVGNYKLVTLLSFRIEFASLFDKLGADGLVLLEQYLLVLPHLRKLHLRFVLSLMQDLLEVVSRMLNLSQLAGQQFPLAVYILEQLEFL